MATTAAQEYKQFVGGEWVAAADGATYEDLDPFTGEIVANAAAGGAADAEQAIEAAAAAFPAWSQTPPAERQRIFLEAADLLESRTEEVVSMLARETGSSFGFGMFQCMFVPNLFRQAAALAYAPLGQIIPSDTGAFAMGMRRPAGVVGAFAPWNAALILSARSIAAPLALGNTVVLKPSEWSPWTGGLLWGEILAEAGMPPGVLNVVTHAPGAAPPVANTMIEHPAVRRLNFTGSSQVGRLIAEAAGRRLKRVVLELGGHNPLIVLGDADLEYAVNASAFGSYLHQGQICMSTRRIYVERPIADEFISRLAEKTKNLKAGDPKEHDTIIGPLINEQALALVRSRVEQAIAEGATVLAGGEAVGPCFQATLLTNVPEDSEFANNETFGPVAAVEIVDDADEAVAKANRTSYGLSAGIITSDRDRGLALAQQIDSGIVHVNDQTVADEPQMPFGGVKDSGFGRFGGQAVVDEFTELRWVTVRSGGHPFPF
ncbi:MAG TPA: aldehyde dehydrogenase family protein [Gaiellaceae bacterium]|jgi:acyl-CoA reductase-like NAD-dependent aldehyde dehydrogenase|nr:aldehyde dehydrogenase family protein [Gaiellaceae bacterium]